MLRHKFGWRTVSRYVCRRAFIQMNYKSDMEDNMKDNKTENIYNSNNNIIKNEFTSSEVPAPICDLNLDNNSLKKEEEEKIKSFSFPSDKSIEDFTGEIINK